MSRRFSVLKQFLSDAKSLVEETQAVLDCVGNSEPTHDQVLKLFRPVHSLKGIASMVEEGRPMIGAYHQLESALPPLLPIQKKDTRQDSQVWKTQAKKTISWTREYLSLLSEKLELWKKLGAEQGEDHGLVLQLEVGSYRPMVWVPITSVTGLISSKGSRIESGVAQIGFQDNATDGIGIEIQNQEFVLWIGELGSVCSRLEAAHRFQAVSIKDWISHQEVARAA